MTKAGSRCTRHLLRESFACKFSFRGAGTIWRTHDRACRNADINILNARDGSRLGALSKGCPNAVKKQCIKPFLDGAMDPKPESVDASSGSLARQWCMIETHPASPSVCHVKGAHVPQPQRCVHKSAGDNQTRALALCPSLERGHSAQDQEEHKSSQAGLLRRRTDEETDKEHQSSHRSTTNRSSTQSSTREPIRRCSVATGMLRLTYRFAAYARGLAQDAFLELRTRFLLHPCSLMTKQPAKQLGKQPVDVPWIRDGTTDAERERVASRTSAASPLTPSAHVPLTRAPSLHLLQTGSWDNAAAALNPLQSSWDLFEVRLAAFD